MSALEEYLFLLNSLVIWAILGVAFVCYGLLLKFCFLQQRDNDWFELTQFWNQGLRQMLTSLPLLGLLGTITGLMTTFKSMATDGGVALQELMTGGIGEALFSTQLGLVMVVPGLLMLALLNHQRCNWMIRRAHEIVD